MRIAVAVALIAGKRPSLVPLFVAGFLLAALARTFLPLSPEVLDAGHAARTSLLSAAMFALGCGVRLSLLMKVCGRKVVLDALSITCVLAHAASGVLSLG